MKHNGQQTANGRVEVGANMAGLARDVISLAELQGRLLVIDVRDVRNRLLFPACAMVVGAVLALSTLPVALMGVAYGLAALFDLSLAVAFLLSALIGMVTCGLLVYFGWRRLAHGFEPLERSQQEFVKNVQWIKQAVSARSGKPAARTL